MKTILASSSNVKLKVSMNGVSLKQCNQMYRKYRLTLTSNQICAGGVEGVDSCKGKKLNISAHISFENKLSLPL